MSSGLNKDRDAWYKKFEESKAIANEALSQIQERNTKHASGGQEASRLTATARRKVGTLGSSIESLRDLLDSPECEHLTEMEKNVRRDMITTLRNGREDMLKLLRRDTQAQNRARLFDSSDNATSSGPPQETVKTAGLDNRGMLQMQQQAIRDQDTELEDLERSVASTKHIALTVNEELDLQARLLDDLDEDVDVADNKLKAAQKKLQKVMKQSGTCKTTLVLIGLMAILMVVLIVCFKLVKWFA